MSAWEPAVYDPDIREAVGLDGLPEASSPGWITEYGTGEARLAEGYLRIRTESSHHGSEGTRLSFRTVEDWYLADGTVVEARLRVLDHGEGLPRSGAQQIAFGNATARSFIGLTRSGIRTSQGRTADVDLSVRHPDPEEAARQLREMLAELEDTPIRTVMYSVGAGSDILYFPSEYGSAWGWRPLPEYADHPTLGPWIEAARELGKTGADMVAVAADWRPPPGLILNLRTRGADGFELYNFRTPLGPLGRAAARWAAEPRAEAGEDRIYGIPPGWPWSKSEPYLADDCYASFLARCRATRRRFISRLCSADFLCKGSQPGIRYRPRGKKPARFGGRSLMASVRALLEPIAASSCSKSAKFIPKAESESLHDATSAKHLGLLPILTNHLLQYLHGTRRNHFVVEKSIQNGLGILQRIQPRLPRQKP